MTEICSDAFRNCKSLSSVTIPENVEYINGYAFAYCQSLTTINIPISVKRIEDGAFEYCTGLTDIYSYIEYPFKIEKFVFVVGSRYEGGKWYYDFTTATLHVPAGCKSLYEAKEGWNNFTNIVEMDDETP